MIVPFLPSYSKPFLPLADQLALLKSRGLQVSDDVAAIECLHRNGYYRLSAYWYPFRVIASQLDAQGKPILDNRGTPLQVRTDQFLPGSRFEDAHALYVFDKKLKLLLLDAIERIEIAARVEVALVLGERNPFAYTQQQLFHPDFTRVVGPRNQSRFQSCTDKFNDRLRSSKDDFVRHHRDKYGQAPLPIWIAIELWDFGLLSFYYEGMAFRDRDAVARRFGIPRRNLMGSWLRSLNYIRNVIAHHGRLWNLNLAISPQLPAAGEMQGFDALLSLRNVNFRLYSICCILSYFTKVVNPTSSWPKDVVNLIESVPAMPYVGLQDMGFPTDWETHAFWH
ncbi:MAG: Abi family protein [Proteobacteria bacterium]|nr:MAG: Abi family protein [Pseudomonadota bacterium]